MWSVWQAVQPESKLKKHIQAVHDKVKSPVLSVALSSPRRLVDSTPAKSTRVLSTPVLSEATSSARKQQEIKLNLEVTKKIM